MDVWGCEWPQWGSGAIGLGLRFSQKLRRFVAIQYGISTSFIGTLTSHNNWTPDTQ